MSNRAHQAKFWDKIAKRYAAHPVANESAYQEKLQITQSFLTSDMNVLEFGCGTGSTAIHHAPLVKSYTAIDISEKMIELCHQKTEGINIEQLKFQQADLDEVQQSGMQYDCILAMSILHLVKDYQAVINQLFSMLHPGGLLISNTSCIDNNMSYLRLILPMMRIIGLAPHVTFFNHKQLEQAMLCAGFSIEKTWWPPGSKTAYFMVCRKPSN